MIGNTSTQSALPRNRSAYREFLSRRMIVLQVAIVGAVVIAFTVSGVSVTGAARIPALLRLAYFLLCAGIGVVVCYSIAAVALYLTRNRTPRDSLLTLAGAILIAIVPCTALAHVAQFHLFSIHTGLLKLYLTVLAVTTPFAIFSFYTAYRRVSPPAPVTAPVPEETTHGDAGQSAGADARADQPPPRGAGRAGQERFFRRLSLKPDGDVVYLKARGHYIDVYTTAGSCSALMRMADAIDDLDASGLRVHRGYWVAHSHVTGLVRHDQSRHLRLTDGAEIPISRTYLPAVRAAFPSLFVPSRGYRAPESPANDSPAVPDAGLTA